MYESQRTRDGEGHCNGLLTPCEAEWDAMLGGDTQTSKQAPNKQDEDQEAKLISRRRTRRKERPRTEDGKLNKASFSTTPSGDVTEQ